MTDEILHSNFNNTEDSLEQLDVIPDYADEDTEDNQDNVEETIEIEFDEDDIVGYLVDENDNEIGLIVLENDVEVEYYYAEEPANEQPKAKKSNEYDLGITRDGVAAATKDVNAIARDGIKVANEFKGAFDDIKSALDFKSLLK